MITPLRRLVNSEYDPGLVPHVIYCSRMRRTLRSPFREKRRTYLVCAVGRGGGGAPVPERIIPDTPEKLPSSLHKHTVFLMQPV